MKIFWKTLRCKTKCSETQENEVAGLVAKCSEVLNNDANARQKYGFDLLDENKKAAMKNARKYGKRSIGLHFMFDQLRNHSPGEPGEKPPTIFLKSILTKIETKKISMPEWALKFLSKA